MTFHQFQCKFCKKTITDYVCRRKKFCSYSCRAKFSNTGIKRSSIWKNIDFYIKQYQSGKTFKQIAEENHISKYSLQIIFKKLSIPARKPGVKFGHIPWNKDKKNLNLGKKNGNWKGNQVKYGGLHNWVRYHKEKPIKCEHCDSTRHLEWANINHKYYRKISDFISLCHKCHDTYDRTNSLR